MKSAPMPTLKSPIDLNRMKWDSFVDSKKKCPYLKRMSDYVIYKNSYICQQDDKSQEVVSQDEFKDTPTSIVNSYKIDGTCFIVHNAPKDPTPECSAPSLLSLAFIDENGNYKAQEKHCCGTMGTCISFSGKVT